MKQKSITVRIDDELKAGAEVVLARLGVSPTEAVTCLYQYLAQHGKLPFRIRMLTESPEDVFTALLRRVRTVHDLIVAVAGLPANDPAHLSMCTRCLLSCQELRRDIAESISFMKDVSCRDPLASGASGDAGEIWRWMDVQLMQAVSVIEKRASDLSDTLTGISRHITDFYWQLAAWVTLCALHESDDSRRRSAR